MSLIVQDASGAIHLVAFSGATTFDVVAGRRTPDGFDEAAVAHVEGECVACGITIACVAAERYKELLDLGFTQVSPRSPEREGYVLMILAPLDLMVTFVPIEEPS